MCIRIHNMFNSYPLTYYKYLKILIVFVFLNCKQNPVLIPGINKADNTKVTQKQSEIIKLGDARCTYGGTKFMTWTDVGEIDGVYQEGVDTNYSEDILCLSTITGTTSIITKPGDFKVTATDIIVGDSDCPQGGKKYESFIDIDGNSTYDSKIDTNYNAKKICNGLNGSASLSGANAGVVATALNSGDTQCPTGGFKIDLFTDMNGNGTYESGVDTFHTVKYLCHGSNSIVLTSTLASGDSTCFSGGTQVTTFTDTNNNGTYEAGIDKNSNTYKVCNGQKALVLSSTLASGDTTCPAGGTQFTICVDSNGDSACTLGPDLNYAVQKVCNGPGAGFLVITENAGANCKAGGYRLDRFQDNNNNGVYDSGTDTGYTSTYICNGLNWLSKRTSFTAGNGTAGDNAACLTGGVRFEFGYDHVNSSNGSYHIGTDGILDIAEIVASATAYSCNGNNSVAGPLISTFQNDSEGTSARFYWDVVSADGEEPKIKIGHSSSKLAIQAWNCEDFFSGINVIEAYGQCTDTAYNPAFVGAGVFASKGKCGFDLTSGPFNLAPWDYNYFRICAQNKSSPYSQTISNYRIAGNVPSGMVMVHQDDWPIHEFANTTIVPFTYAIDKWEAYLSSGSITNGVPGGCGAASCISTTTGVLSSASGQTPAHTIDWYASRKACRNRIAAGYTDTTIPRSIHLVTEMEYFVANYETPDDTHYGDGGNLNAPYYGAFSGYLGCNIDMRHIENDTTYNGNEFFQTGNVATQDCISRYGARDLIGNYGEFTDGYYEFLTNNITRQKSVYWGSADKVTTVISDANLGYTFPVATIAGSIGDWDYENLLPKVIWQGGVTQKFFMDIFRLDTTSATRVSTHHYSPVGGGTQTGRFSKELYYSATQNGNAHGVRCAVVSP